MVRFGRVEWLTVAAIGFVLAVIANPPTWGAFGFAWVGSTAGAAIWLFLSKKAYELVGGASDDGDRARRSPDKRSRYQRGRQRRTRRDE